MNTAACSIQSGSREIPQYGVATGSGQQARQRLAVLTHLPSLM